MKQQIMFRAVFGNKRDAGGKRGEKNRKGQAGKGRIPETAVYLYFILYCSLNRIKTAFLSLYTLDIASFNGVIQVLISRVI